MDGNMGVGNRQGIGIEICYSKSGGARFTKAEDNGAQLVASLLKKYGWGIEKVTKHQDYSGKYCPHRTLDLGWQRFLDMVKKYMNESEDDIDMKTAEVLKGYIDGIQKQVDNLIKSVNDFKRAVATTTEANNRAFSAAIADLRQLVMPKYGYIDKNMPDWMKPTIQKLVDKGILKGDEKSNLQLTEDMARTLVILDRTGVFDK